MIELNPHEPASGLSRLYPARGTWPAVRFLFAKPAKEAILERASNTFLKKITIHTDGACDGNPGPGGWAALPALR